MRGHVVGDVEVSPALVNGSVMFISPIRIFLKDVQIEKHNPFTHYNCPP